MGTKILKQGIYGNHGTCTQCGRSGKVRQCFDYSKFFGSTVYFCSAGCMHAYAQNNGLTVKRPLLGGW